MGIAPEDDTLTLGKGKPSVTIEGIDMVIVAVDVTKTVVSAPPIVVVSNPPY